MTKQFFITAFFNFRGSKQDLEAELPMMQIVQVHLITFPEFHKSNLDSQWSVCCLVICKYRNSAVVRIVPVVDYNAVFITVLLFQSLICLFYGSHAILRRTSFNYVVLYIYKIYEYIINITSNLFRTCKTQYTTVFKISVKMNSVILIIDPKS